MNNIKIKKLKIKMKKNIINNFQSKVINNLTKY